MQQHTQLIEDMRSFLRENSNHLLSLSVQLETLESLQTQIAWLQEDFAEVKHSMENPTPYFHEWCTKLHVIDALFSLTIKEVMEVYKNLKYLSEGSQEELNDFKDGTKKPLRQQ